MFGYVILVSPPRLAEPSGNLKALAEQWTDQGRTLAVSGVAGREYRINLIDADRILTTTGATRNGDDLVVRMPARNAGKYVPHQIMLRL